MNEIIVNKHFVKAVHLKLKFTAFLFCITLSGFTQVVIKGVVKDSVKTLTNVTVLVKNKKTKNTLQYTVTDKNGKYFIELKHIKDSVYLEFNSFLYETLISNLDDETLLKDNSVTLNVVLKENVNELNEILIKAKQRITIKKDTTIYNVDSFKDGTERTVEDLLKKLPGVSVGNNGEIKYKGKSIKKLLLDGDDLFDSNYTIASKNINVDIVDKIQGIENYDENSLKKGLRDSDDVILNLVLKKGKLNFSGNVDLAYGYKNMHKINGVGMLLNNKVKLFNYTSLNNIGYKNSQVFKKNGTLSAKKLINEGNFYSILDDSFHNFNNNFINSSNILFKLFKKSKVRFNLNGEVDSKNRINSSSISINDDSQTLITTTEKINNKPTNLNAEIFFENKEKGNLHWSYLGYYDHKKKNSNNFSNNNGLSQQSNLISKTKLIQNKVNLTYRINEKSALESILTHSLSEAPQELNLSPNTLFNNEGNNILEFNNQTSRFKKQYFLFKTDVIGLHKKNQYKIEIGYNYISNQYNSLLKNSVNQNETYVNNTEYRIGSYFINSGYNFKFEKSNIGLGLKLNYNNLALQNFSDNDFISKSSILALPYLKLKYNLSKMIGFSLNYNYNEKTPSENNLFTNIVQTNFRNFLDNKIALDNLTSHNFNMDFKYYDFYNRTSINLGIQYIHNKNGYFFNNIINEDISITTSFLKNEGLNNYNIFLNSETFVLFLNSTLQFNTSYTISEDLNTLNGSDFRNITINDLQLEFVARTGFKMPVNFENTFMYNNSTFKTELKNSNSSISNQFKSIIKIKNDSNIKVLYTHIKPNFQNKVNYNFIEAELFLKPKNSNFSYSILAKNLLNEKQFEVININDFSTSRSYYNLIERYIMLQVSFYL
ncbi:hypothetical protein H7F37_14160 [Winogradskyella sp. PAMC22761]|nr:hypothetical protein H7F37_14160 [Winogradskyella sp. PAMC22761]